MTIQAIETHYAGCRFRSRLEARWAVFFDRLGIRWEYEPQGFQVTYRLSLADGTFNYLPDFWLPNYKLWVEVKGSLTEPEAERLLNAAASLSSNNGGGCHDSGGHDLLVLGSVPHLGLPSTTWSPTRLHMHKGDLVASGGFSKGSPCDGITVARDVGGSLDTICREAEHTIAEVINTLLYGVGDARRTDRSNVQVALSAARSARFEHGERGR